MLLQVMLILIYGFIDSGFGAMGDLGEFFKMVIFLTMYGYLVTGIQSILYAVLMEFVLNPRIKNDLLVLLSSSFLGALSGYSVMAILFEKGISDSLEWLFVSAVTGLLMGILLRDNFCRASQGVASEV